MKNLIRYIKEESVHIASIKALVRRLENVCLSSSRLSLSVVDSRLVLHYRMVETSNASFPIQVVDYGQGVSNRTLQLEVNSLLETASRYANLEGAPE